MTLYDKLLFELSVEGRVGYRLPPLDVEEKPMDQLIDPRFLAEDKPNLPQVSEVDVIRHYTNLSEKNYSLDHGFYPLGSCTMKYNPKINEDMAGLSGFTGAHPLQESYTVQGNLELLYNLQESLKEIAGMDAFTLQPAAGAQGESTGVMLIKAYHESRGDHHRTKMLVPDQAHGTNPATAAMTGYDAVEIPSTPEGIVDVEALRGIIGEDIAGLMLTNPNTLGLFDPNIREIADMVHEAGGLLYYDGANMNAIMGYARPGDMGFDVVHFNLHKTFSTPHGGGGPGAGPVGCKALLEPFLPKPVIVKEGDTYAFEWNRPQSIGKVKDYMGHFAILVRAYTYILTMGYDGLKRASEVAVLNANYLAQKLKDDYDLPIETTYMHEFVLGGLKDKTNGVTTLDVAKRLLDKGFHAPTVYFPLIIPEAIMIEPTESESKETLDVFIEAMDEIAREAKEDPELLKGAPHHTIVSRPDETQAAKHPVLKYETGGKA